MSLCGLAAALAMVLWAVSLRTAADVRLPCPGATLAIGWAEGSLKIGALDYDDGPRWTWWGRRGAMSLDQVGPGLDFHSNLWGWAVSIPFPLLLVGLAVPPLWWFLVYRDRAEFSRRIEMGLCLNCGYDARQSTGGRCSECGQNPRQAIAPS
jgi:hypothetical protein